MRSSWEADDVERSGGPECGVRMNAVVLPSDGEWGGVGGRPAGSQWRALQGKANTWGLL